MVPSSGSTTQRTPLVPAMSTPSSPRIAVVGPPARAGAPRSAPPRPGRSPSPCRCRCSSCSPPPAPGPALDAAARPRPARCAPPASASASRSAGSLITADTRFRCVPDPHGRVDLRTDTVTRPTAAMRRAMAEAEVGDDGFGDDPTVARLEAAFAERVGKEAAVFVPSGTMANQIALRVLGAAGHRRVRGTAAAPGGAGGGRGRHERGRAGGDARRRRRHDRSGGRSSGGWTTPASDGRRRPRCSWRTPTVRSAGGCGRSSGSRRWPRSGCRSTSTALACGTRRSPRTPTVAERAAPATTVTCCVSKGLGAPVGSLARRPG